MKKIKKYDGHEVIVDSESPNAFIFDLDGTVNHMNGRFPFDSKGAVGDMPNTPVIIVIKALMQSYPNAAFIAVSGRTDDAYDITMENLKDNGIRPNYLYMRETGDFRKDSIIKEEIYNKYIKGVYNVIAVFDDRKQTVDGWRSLGLPCFQVAPGEF